MESPAEKRLKPPLETLGPRGHLGLATLARIEQNEGLVKGNFSTAIKIQNALEQAGTAFTDDGAGAIGVKLLEKKG
jgi:hypothetical protein